MVHFEQRPLWSPVALGCCGISGGMGVWTLWYDPTFALAVWYLPFGLIGMAVMIWVTIGRHAHRTLRVDDEGVWIDGDLAIQPSQVVAITAAADLDPVGTVMHLRARPGHELSFLQHNWLRVLEVDGHGTVVISRERDLGRATGFGGIVVVTDESDEGHPAGWFLPSLRRRQLGAALLAIAPDADVAAARDPRPAPLRAIEPPGAAADPDQA